MASAQTAPAAKATDGFVDGYTDIGPVLGIGGIGSAGVSIGGRFEHAIEPLPSLADGVLSVALSFDHYYYSAFGGNFSYTPIAATLNYHFRLDQRQWDPFVGLGLGDYIVSAPPGCQGCAFNSGVYLVGHLGLRYFWTPKLAVYGDVGSGAGALHVGVMWKLGGKS
jgi:hypothetical protein